MGTNDFFPVFDGELGVFYLNNAKLSMLCFIHKKKRIIYSPTACVLCNGATCCLTAPFTDGT